MHTWLTLQYLRVRISSMLDKLLPRRRREPMQTFEDDTDHR